MYDIQNALEGLATDRDQAVRFWAAFARFEYALKKAGLLQERPDYAAASWRKFAKAIFHSWNSTTSEERPEAAAFILSQPPEKQMRNGTNMKWSKEPLEGENDLERLLDAVNRIRNNLFHGSKFAIGPEEGRNRSDKLIKSALVILTECLRIATEIKHPVAEHFRGP